MVNGINILRHGGIVTVIFLLMSLLCKSPSLLKKIIVHLLRNITKNFLQMQNIPRNGNKCFLKQNYGIFQIYIVLTLTNDKFSYLPRKSVAVTN